MKKKLALVGCGIKSISHFTTEFKAYVTNADRVLYLVNEPITIQWLETHSKSAESLELIYFSESDRKKSYEKIKNKIINEFDHYNFITVVLYGHPTVFAQPGLDALAIAKMNSIETIILPGISIENCLYADLEIDPGQFGCLHIEATELLLYDKLIDPTSHLCIWQIGMIGNCSTPKPNQKAQHLDLLKNKLRTYYPNHHRMIAYEAALYPTLEPRIESFTLEDIERISISTLSTLYVPPIAQRKINQEIVRQFQQWNN